MELIREVGAFAGLAAFLGLAVLALLYFAQARDVRRLRENAEFLVEGGEDRDAQVPPPIGAEGEAEATERRQAPPASEAEAFRRAELARQAADRRERARRAGTRSEEHTSELQSLRHLVCRLLLEKKKRDTQNK